MLTSFVNPKSMGNALLQFPRIRLAYQTRDMHDKNRSHEKLAGSEEHRSLVAPHKSCTPRLGQELR
jgi:hypothetical protein